SGVGEIAGHKRGLDPGVEVSDLLAAAAGRLRRLASLGVYVPDLARTSRVDEGGVSPHAGNVAAEVDDAVRVGQDVGAGGAGEVHVGEEVVAGVEGPLTHDARLIAGVVLAPLFALLIDVLLTREGGCLGGVEAFFAGDARGIEDGDMHPHPERVVRLPDLRHRRGGVGGVGD